MKLEIAVVVLAVGCAASRAPSTPPPSAPAGPSDAELQAQRARDDQAKHDQIVAAHRALEDEQQTALAATCDDPAPRSEHERCLPSCYTTEPADARAGKKLAGSMELEHLVCKQRDDGPLVLADEIQRGKLRVRSVRGRFPAAHKTTSWQGEIEVALADAPHAKTAKSDVFVVTSGWRELIHPVTRERLRCVTVSHYVRGARGVLDACGAGHDVACEASGNAAVRGINVVHYRLAEARELKAAGKLDECRRAALEAIAVARGMPRWRQYAKLNVAHWIDHAAYRTRFDGILDEDALFAAAASLGSDAEAVYTSCGGPGDAATKPEDEQSFHTCW
ncbi:MAG TPA: hypothetical protein VGF94_21425 [Kofleriaceae bacterium]|jgi:hypothetical protein